MNIAVILAGVADPKWPLTIPVEAAGTPRVDDRAAPRVLSPFDEAALELALRLRDAQREVRITAVLLTPVGNDPLLRTVAAYRPDQLHGLDSQSLQRWDAWLLSAQLMTFVLGLDHEVDLVLTGRELGDHDSGTLPPCLAEQLGWRFAGLIQSVEWAGPALKLMRERGDVEEWMTLPFPLVASITNDRRNRLRHPLFKNVVAARRASFTLVSAPAPAESPRVTLTAARLEGSRRRASSCRVLEGSTAAQAAELAEFLEQFRSNA